MSKKKVTIKLEPSPQHIENITTLVQSLGVSHIEEAVIKLDTEIKLHDMIELLNQILDDKANIVTESDQLDSGSDKPTLFIAPVKTGGLQLCVIIPAGSKTLFDAKFENKNLLIYFVDPAKSGAPSKSISNLLKAKFPDIDDTDIISANKVQQGNPLDNGWLILYNVLLIISGVSFDTVSKVEDTDRKLAYYIRKQVGQYQKSEGIQTEKIQNRGNPKKLQKKPLANDSPERLKLIGTIGTEQDNSKPNMPAVATSVISALSTLWSALSTTVTPSNSPTSGPISSPNTNSSVPVAPTPSGPSTNTLVTTIIPAIITIISGGFVIYNKFIRGTNPETYGEAILIKTDEQSEANPGSVTVRMSHQEYKECDNNDDRSKKEKQRIIKAASDYLAKNPNATKIVVLPVDPKDPASDLIAKHWSDHARGWTFDLVTPPDKDNRDLSLL